MKNKLLFKVLCLTMLTLVLASSVVSCKQQNTPEKSYAGCYQRVKVVIDAAKKITSDMISDNNKALKDKYPDNFADQAGYIPSNPYNPFWSLELIVTSVFHEEQSDTDALESIAVLAKDTVYPSATDFKYYHHEANHYGATFMVNNTLVEYDCRYYPETDSMVFLSYNTFEGKAKEQTEFFEFITLGENRYALQNETARGIFTVVNGVATAFEVSIFTEGYNAQECSIAPKGEGCDSAWVMEKGRDALKNVFTYDGSVLTMSTHLKKNEEWADWKVIVLPAGAKVDPIS